MCEILVKANVVVHPNPIKDRMGVYKRGMAVSVFPDGHPWGNEERLPLFVVIKIPGIPVSNAIIQKYVLTQDEDVARDDGTYEIYRRRRWIIRWDDLPLAARNKLALTGQLVIKAGTYAGTYDYTWAQIRGYFRDQKTGLNETASI